jgi:hypothetical protein
VLRIGDLDRAPAFYGNLIELYVDADEALWRDDPTSVANSDPLPFA